MKAPDLVKHIIVSNLLEGRRYLIEWQPLSDTDITHYNIYRSEAHYTGFTKVGQASGQDNQFVDVVPQVWGVVYFYKVTATNEEGWESDLSRSFPASSISTSGFSQEVFLNDLIPKDLISQEEPIGVKDGENVTFRTQNAYHPNTLEVVLDYLTLFRDIDFEEVDGVHFRFIGNFATSPPSPDDIMRVSYIRI